jgi:hypothetical protein
MSLRPAPVGSLLKQPSSSSKGAGSSSKPPKGKRQAPAFNAGKHLAAIRCLPCCSCDTDPAGIAAHVRMADAAAGKADSGMGRKPDDRWTVPMCRSCHTDAPDSQHALGEVQFWAHLGIDPLWLCAQLASASPDVGRMRDIIFKTREVRKS